MPLERVEVRNEYALGAPELYREANKEDPKEILEGITVSGLVGVLRQLGDLAEFAGEVFHGLQEEVTITSSRSRKLMGRVHRLEAALSPLEKAVLAQKSHLHFAYTAGSNWHARIRCRQSHILYSEMPEFIMGPYEDSRDLPNLHLLDRFDPGGPGSCLKRYSDPTFFKRASVASGEITAKKISKEKKGRRIKKRKSWPRNGEVSGDASFSCSGGRMQFTQLNIGVHPSPTQTATTLRSELDEQLNLHLRNGSGFTEGESRPSYSVQLEEQESRESISSPVMRRNSDFLDYDFLRAKSTDAYDDIQINLSQERAASSSVTCDERGETHNHITQQSDDDDLMIQDNYNGHLESFSLNFGLEIVDDIALDFEAIEKMDVQPQAGPALENTDAHCDDIESETDHFMDALNTIESEGDTDVDWGKKAEMQQYSKLVDNRVQDEVCQTIRHNLEWQSSSIESNVLANDSFTSVPDTSCEHHDSVSPKSLAEINGVAPDHEFNLVFLDGKTASSSQTVAVSSTPGSPYQAREEFQLVSLGDKTLQSSQADGILSSPSSLIQAKDEFKSSQPNGMPSFPDSPLQAKDELNSFQPDGMPSSLCNPLQTKDEFKSSQADEMPSSPGSPLLAKDEFNSSQPDGMPSSGSPLQAKAEFKSSQADEMPSSQTNSLQAKYEFNSVSVSDTTLLSSQVEAVSATPGSPLQEKDEFDRVSIVDTILQSSQTDATSSTPDILFKAKDEFNSVSSVDKTLQSIGVSLTPGSPIVDSCENGSINTGKKEPVSCTSSADYRDNRTGIPITDCTRSSFESQKHASDTSSVASVSFWTNGGLLGLQPSKPPDFSRLNGTPQDPGYEDGKISLCDRPDNLKNIEEDNDMNSPNSHEYQESSISSRKPSWKISPADLSIDLSKLAKSINSSTSSIGSSATASRGLLPINSTSQATGNHQEYSGSSSQMFGLSSRLRPNGSNKKLLPGGDEDSCAVEHQYANDFEQKNYQNAASRTFSGRNKLLLCRESPISSPCSSPPLQHMKISFQPMDGFDTSKLKLKFPEGNNNSKSVSDIFPSFQLVPEASITQHNDGSDSDADTFYRSSPSLSDDCHSNQSESNSEKWESSESPTSKDHELYDSLRRISLTESVSTAGIGLQNSEPSQMFDHQSLGSGSLSFRKELRNATSKKDLVGPHLEPSPDPPPHPPVQWQSMMPHLDGMENKSEIMAEDSYYAFHLQHSSSTISQPKPAPAKEEHMSNVKLQIRKFNSEGTKAQRGALPAKNTYEKGDFLHQIRTKSFNLRPTFIDKVPPPETSSAHLQVNAILEKANAIRQAVGSDEDDGTWSDT